MTDKKVFRFGGLHFLCTFAANFINTILNIKRNEKR
jgi:hypothetical protein